MRDIDYCCWGEHQPMAVLPVHDSAAHPTAPGAPHTLLGSRERSIMIFSALLDDERTGTGDINIDAILFHPNATDVAARINDSKVKDTAFALCFHCLCG